MERTLSSSLKLNFTPNNLDCHGLTSFIRRTRTKNALPVEQTKTVTSCCLTLCHFPVDASCRKYVMYGLKMAADDVQKFGTMAMQKITYISYRIFEFFFLDLVLVLV